VKKLVRLFVLVLILLATSLPAHAGGDQNHGCNGQGSVYLWGSPNGSCP
jgi:hypothetical protein